MLKRGFVYCLLFVGLFHTCYSQKIDSHKIDSLFTVLESQNKAMGCLTITHNNSVLYSRAIGFTSIEDAHKASSKTEYRIGSITKMFTSALVFQLIDNGKLHLYTKLSDFYPQIPNASEITIEQMLNHHSGIYSYTNSPSYNDWSVTFKTEQQLIDSISKHEPLFEPGTKGDYSNSNFLLLGYIIQKITGKTYSEVLKANIINKLKLNNTYVGVASNLSKNECYSYDWIDNKWVKHSETDMSIPAAAGAIVATTYDVDKFITGLFSGKLISKSSLDTMKTIKDGFGMGMFEYPFIGQIKFSFTDKQAYGHIGGIDGFASVLVYLPKEQLAVAYCTNGVNEDFSDVMADVFKYIQ